jgi:hypothetical protein
MPKVERPPSIEERIAAAINPEPQPAPAPEVPQEAPEAPQETPQEAQAPQAEAAPEQPAETPQEAAEEGEAPVEVGTLSDLADHLGVPTEELYRIAIPVTVGGKRREVSLSEWKDAYQAREELAHEVTETRALREQLEAERHDARARLEAAVAEAGALTQQAEQRLLAEWNSPQLAALRDTDPARWAARRQELQEQAAQVQQAKQASIETLRQYREANEGQQAEQIEKWREAEADKLLKAVPEWADAELRSREVGELRDYMVAEVGFAPGEVDNIYDHRLVLLAKKARAYDAQRSKVEVSKKRLVKIGKTQKPGPGASKQIAREDRDASLRRALRESGSVDAAAAIISARRSS